MPNEAGMLTNAKHAAVMVAEATNLRRDRFAEAALPAVFYSYRSSNVHLSLADSAAAIAERAYTIADAMLAERAKRVR